MERFISDSPEETVEIGKKIASYLKAGDCVLYTGEMGAGKTVSYTHLDVYKRQTLPSASIRLNLFFMRIKFIIALPVIMQIITAYEMPMIFISDEPKSRSGENIINSTMGTVSYTHLIFYYRLLRAIVHSRPSHKAQPTANLSKGRNLPCPTGALFY